MNQTQPSEFVILLAQPKVKGVDQKLNPRNQKSDKSTKCEFDFK